MPKRTGHVLGGARNDIKIVEVDSYPKAIVLLQQMTRVEKTRLLTVIESPCNGFPDDLAVFYKDIRKRSRSDFFHQSVTLMGLKKEYNSAKKKPDDWLNQMLHLLTNAINLTLNREFLLRNPGLDAYMIAVNQLNMRQPKFYKEALVNLEEKLEDTLPFDGINPFLNYQLQIMKQADMEKALQREQHSAYKNAFIELDKFYLLQQLHLGIELCNRRRVFNQKDLDLDIDRVAGLLHHPQFISLATDKNVQLLINFFQLFNNPKEDAAFAEGVERLWINIRPLINERNTSVAQYISALMIRCINKGYSNFNRHFLDLIEHLFGCKYYERPGSITGTMVKNIVKVALNDKDLGFAEWARDHLYPLVSDDKKGIIRTLIEINILRFSGDLLTALEKLQSIVQNSNVYETLTIYRNIIMMDIEATDDVNSFIDLPDHIGAATIKNLQNYLSLNSDTIPEDKITAHKNFIAGIKRMQQITPGDSFEKKAFISWVDSCENIAERNWFVVRAQRK